MTLAAPSDFSAVAREAFGYLTERHGYVLTRDEWRQPGASWVVRYDRSGRTVDLVWGLKDAQFYFRVQRTDSEGPGRNWFYIFELVRHHAPAHPRARDLDIGTSAPTLAALRQRVHANADALRTFGESVVSGDEWFDPESSTSRAT